MPRSLASRTRFPATSRTWVTPPGTPVASAEPIVWTESTISSRGLTFSTWVTRALEVGLGGQVEVVDDRADAVGPHAHLGGRTPRP